MFECESPTCDQCPHSKFSWGTEEMMCTAVRNMAKHRKQLAVQMIEHEPEAPDRAEAG